MLTRNVWIAKRYLLVMPPTSFILVSVYDGFEAWV